VRFVWLERSSKEHFEGPSSQVSLRVRASTALDLLLLLISLDLSSIIFLQLHLLPQEMGTIAMSGNSIAFFFNHLLIDPHYCHVRLSFRAQNFYYYYRCFI
jgi:hypothetical protein